MITVKEKSKRKKRVKTGKARHAGTGKFVSKDFAKANSEIVVEETKPVVNNDSVSKIQPFENT